MREEKIDGVYYRLDKDNLTAEVIEQRTGIDNDYRGDIIIRETVVSNEVSYLVTSIGEQAFSCCKSLKSISIPRSVTSIGEKAFDGCLSLTTIEVAKDNTVYDSRENCNALIHTATNTIIRGCQNTTIPNSVTNIGYRAFYGCESLKSIIIPDSVTSIGEMAFYCCESLKSIIISDSVTSIGEMAFDRCHSLTTIEVAKRNTMYDSRENCNALIHTATNTLILGCQNTTIPNSVKSIGDRAFCECISLKSIVIPNSVTSIGKDAFGCCFSLKSINIPDSVTSIGDSAFKDCESLKYITIPDSVTTIAWGTFDHCKSLKAIAIPESVRCIGDYAFKDCESLKYIVIPVSVISIGYAFSGCESLYTICYDGTKEQWKKITLDKVGGSWLHVECYDGNMKI